MTQWHFATPTTSEAPFAWNYLHNRYRMDRALSVVEVTPGVYALDRYDAYTNELGAKNYPVNPNADHTDFWPAVRTGLNYFRGGYDWIVDDTTKANLIASNIGIDNTNFTAISTAGFGEGGYGQGGFGG